MDTDLDRIIRDSFEEFVGWLFARESEPANQLPRDGAPHGAHWLGREREAISLYAIGFLLKRCQTGAVLSDTTQIGIEVAVPGVPSLNKKRPCRVNKDLVIWPEPGMTTWDESWQPVRYPRAVLEWKVFRRIHRKPLLSQTNLLWLTAFCKQAPDCTGYAVAVDLESRAFKGQIARVTGASIDEHWMEIG